MSRRTVPEAASTDRTQVSDFDLAIETLRELATGAEDERTRERAAASLGRLSQKSKRDTAVARPDPRPSLAPAQLLDAIVDEIVSGLRDGRYSFEMVIHAIEPLLGVLYKDEKSFTNLALAMHTGKVDSQAAGGTPGAPDYSPGPVRGGVPVAF